MVIWIIGLCVIFLPVLGLALLSWFSAPPSNLGVHDGRLTACPDSPNCVCSQSSDESHFVEPFAFRGTQAETAARLHQILLEQPQTAIVEENERYLRAEVTSAVFRFVDDIEFLLDPATETVHVRSASRAGRSDLGVNRKRVEEIRRQYQSADG